MEPTVRRQAILTQLETATTALSATALAQQFAVSRQVIVGDIALLRAGGAQIHPTPRGYVLPATAPIAIRQIACEHFPDTMERELHLLVDSGCTVVDVSVEHPVYGQLTGMLQLENRFDVGEFMTRSAGVPPLSALTQGIHLHTISAPSEDILQRGVDALDKAGFLVGENCT